MGSELISLEVFIPWDFRLGNIFRREKRWPIPTPRNGYKDDFKNTEMSIAAFAQLESETHRGVNIGRMFFLFLYIQHTMQDCVVRLNQNKKMSKGNIINQINIGVKLYLAWRPRGWWWPWCGSAPRRWRQAAAPQTPTSGRSSSWRWCWTRTPGSR